MDCGHRAAFREFGGVMGLKCYKEFDEGDYWKHWVDKVLSQWRRAGVIPIPSGRLAQLPRVKKLGPITGVMFAAALIPGGEILSQTKRRRMMVLTEVAFRNGWVEAKMKRVRRGD